ncbi:hypothetical protein ACIKIA_30300 [Bacillus thuringiensis]
MPTDYANRTVRFIIFLVIHIVLFWQKGIEIPKEEGGFLNTF